MTNQPESQLKGLYIKFRDTPSRLNKLMDSISFYAGASDTIVEFGVGRCEGMLACLNSGPEYYEGYTHKVTPGIIEVGQLAGAVWEGIGINVREETPKCSFLEYEFDMLLVDGEFMERSKYGLEMLDDVSMINRYIFIHNYEKEILFSDFKVKERINQHTKIYKRHD